MKPSISVELMPPNLLHKNPWNTNRMSPENEQKLEESIKRLGMFKPVVVRELQNGDLEILGGEHRWDAAKRLGLKEVPVVNLGRVDDKKAKEIGLVDNGRYGADDMLQLAELLEGLGEAADLATFLPYTDADIATIFSSVNISLDALDLPDDDSPPPIPREKPIQTHSIMRFKVPVEDVAMVTEVIERIMKTQKFTQEDSLTNAGHALVHLCQRSEV